MLLRDFGTTGLKVSAVGLGCNNFGGRLDRAATAKVVHAALDAGITLFDTADLYSRGASETMLGEALGNRRKDAVLVTKFGVTMDESGRRGTEGSARYVREAIEASLRRLKTDWIDVYYHHRPDPKTPIEETLSALDELVRAGKVRHIGCSNFSAAQIDAADTVAHQKGLARFVTAQDQYSLLARDIERDLMPAIEKHRLALLPYFPLASGMLSGKYRLGRPLPAGTRLANPRYSDRVLNDANLRVVERLEQLCAARGRTLLQLAFGWLLARPAVASVIAGATTLEQVRQNAGAVGWELSPDEIAEADRITRR